MDGWAAFGSPMARRFASGVENAGNPRHSRYLEC